MRHAGLRQAVLQAVQAGDIIRGLRRIFGGGDVDPSAQDINEAVREVISLILAGAKEEKVTTVLELSDDLPAAIFDKVQVQQVLFNLVRNSIEAMHNSKRRKLTVRTFQADDAIEVSISDTGPGLPTEVRDHLFEPFMTTKPEGMGVGLSICHGVIEAHRGKLWTSPNSGGGTVFSFTLPRKPVAPIERAEVA